MITSSVVLLDLLRLMRLLGNKDVRKVVKRQRALSGIKVMHLSTRSSCQNKNDLLINHQRCFAIREPRSLHIITHELGNKRLFIGGGRSERLFLEE